MTNLIDLATLTDHNNYSYRTQQDLLFYAPGDDLDMIGMSFILPANSTVWYYSEDPGRLVFRYSERPGALGGPDAEHSVSVYGDGRVVAHRPRFTTRAGSWGTQLGREEMEELVRSLVEPGLVEFDETRALQSRRDLRKQRRLQRGELFEVSDADTVTLELHLDRYRGRGPGARERRNVVKRIRWRGLRSDLRRYPELTDLEGLGTVQGRIHALMERPDLSRLDSAGQP